MQHESRACAAHILSSLHADRVQSVWPASPVGLRWAAQRQLRAGTGTAASPPSLCCSIFRPAAGLTPYCWTLTAMCGPTSAWDTSSSAPLQGKWVPPPCLTRCAVLHRLYCTSVHMVSPHFINCCTNAMPACLLIMVDLKPPLAEGMPQACLTRTPAPTWAPQRPWCFLFACLPLATPSCGLVPSRLHAKQRHGHPLPTHRATLSTPC